MMQGQSVGAPGVGGTHRWLDVLLSLAVGVAFFALWFWLLPGWLGFEVEVGEAARWRWLAAVPSVLGFALALRCIWDFGWTGRGTPAPMVPPKRLVVVGFYRYVRNPMYWGFAAGWIGLWVVSSSMRSLLCARNLGRSTRTILEMYGVGGRERKAGTRRNANRFLALSRILTWTPDPALQLAASPRPSVLAIRDRSAAQG
jgi:steroid 5-alpha reductase family enzyme